jgi:hypothetical protein
MVGKHEEKKPLGRSMYRWQGNIKVGVEVEWECVACFGRLIMQSSGRLF